MEKLQQLIEDLLFVRSEILNAPVRNDAEKRVNDYALYDVEFKLIQYELQLTKIKNKQLS